MSGIALYNRGYCLSFPRRDKDSPRKGGGKRGKLVGNVSKASFRRFRAWCITHDLESDCWGLTLTVPGIELLSVDQFKALHHRLCVWCNDHSIPLVWRVELQKRGQPHMHCVLFGSVEMAQNLLFRWFKLLQSLPLVYNVERVSSEKDDICKINRAFLRGSSHAVDLQRLSGDFRAWRYLVAHMSKGKQDQLGWAGRNWGVCNRSLFNVLPGEKYEMCDASFWLLRRWVRRLQSGVKRKGSRRRFSARRGDAFHLGNPATIRSMFLFVRDLEKLSCSFSSYRRSFRDRKSCFLYSWFGLQLLSLLSPAFDQRLLDDLSSGCSRCLFDTILFFALYF